LFYLSEFVSSSDLDIHSRSAFSFHNFIQLNNSTLELLLYVCICSGTPLALRLSSNVGYNTPQNVAFLGTPFLYYGFLPISTASTSGSTQGLKVCNLCIAHYVEFFNVPTKYDIQATRYAAGNINRLSFTQSRLLLHWFETKLYRLVRTANAAEWHAVSTTL
jgi:hypothetical protein